MISEGINLVLGKKQKNESKEDMFSSDEIFYTQNSYLKKILNCNTLEYRLGMANALFICISATASPVQYIWIFWW